MREYEEVCLSCQVSKTCQEAVDCSSSVADAGRGGRSLFALQTPNFNLNDRIGFPVSPSRPTLILLRYGIFKAECSCSVEISRRFYYFLSKVDL
jgi:hypothetical protein